MKVTQTVHRCPSFKASGRNKKNKTPNENEARQHMNRPQGCSATIAESKREFLESKLNGEKNGKPLVLLYGHGEEIEDENGSESSQNVNKDLVKNDVTYFTASRQLLSFSLPKKAITTGELSDFPYYETYRSIDNEPIKNLKIYRLNEDDDEYISPEEISPNVKVHEIKKEWTTLEDVMKEYPDHPIGVLACRRKPSIEPETTVGEEHIRNYQKVEEFDVACENHTELSEQIEALELELENINVRIKKQKASGDTANLIEQLNKEKQEVNNKIKKLEEVKDNIFGLIERLDQESIIR